MKQEKGEKPQSEIRLNISSGVEIKIGQIVPILQHSSCSGNWGTVVGINPLNRSYSMNCNSCGKNVFLDIKTLSK